MKVGLAPIVGEACTVLILGSLPGEASLQQQQYYAYPQNQFWRILSALLQEELPCDYAQKCHMLLMHHVALWDVIHFAERDGSLDIAFPL